jgi:abortive infection bacteriophage resistance protein
MSQSYDKSHLSFPEQLSRLCDRGLICPDEDRALGVLKAAGYYRFSAYVYPFRVPLTEDETPTSPFHFRSDRITEGTTFEHVERLWRFDRALRLTWLDALETIEVGVRTQVAYVLGMRDTFGHVNRSALDPVACRELVHSRGSRREAFDVWMTKYEELRSNAINEDYMQHNLHKYEGNVPVWIAVEFLDFGAAVRLLRLMHAEDQNAISRSMGIKVGKQLANVLQQLNYVRNLCAHHARLWNRTLTYKIKNYPMAAMPDLLGHLADVEQREKVYIPLAYSAQLAHELDPVGNWPSRLRTIVRKFPDIPAMSPETHMGFPAGWADLSLWKSHERR